MSAETPSKREIQAGVGVIGGLVLLCVALWGWLAFQERHQQSYIVRFTTEQGVYGLRPDSPVRIGGLLSGRVEAISPRIERGEVVGYDVAIVVQGQTRLFRGVRIESGGGGVAGDAAIEILDLGRASPSHTAPMGAASAQESLPEGSIILAADAPRFRNFVGDRGAPNLATVVDRLAAFRAQYTPIAEELSIKFPALRSDLTALTDRLRADVGPWRAQFEETRTAALHAIATLGAGADAAPDAVMPQLRAAASDFDAVRALDTSRAELSVAALKHAIAQIGSLRDHGEALSSIVKDTENGLAHAMADFSVTGQELDAGKREALRAPWQLFATPDAAERARAWQIEQARIYAQATTDFRRAIDGIQKSLSRDAALLQKLPGLADLLQTQTEAASRIFDEQTQRYIDMLIGPPAAK